MTRLPFFFLLLIVTLAGCTPHGWAARWYIVQAETALGKAHHLKDQKIPFERRLPHYAKACNAYVKAYEIDPAVFTLIRIEEAADCCWKAEMKDGEALFRQFEEEYSKAHPQEVEYGDAGVGMVEMG
jgi:hypothetical protein